MKTPTRFGLAALALAAFLGCLRVPGGIAPSSTPTEGRSYQVLGDAFGKSTQLFVLGIPTGSAALTQDALADARVKSGGDALIEVTVEAYVKNYILFSTMTTEVRGKAIKFTSPAK